MRKHHPYYEDTCREKGVTLHQCGLPKKIVSARKAAAATLEAQTAAKAAGKNPDAGKVTGYFAPAQGPQEFSIASGLEHISKYIVTTDQVSPSC